MNVILAGTSAISSNETDLYFQCIKLLSKRQLDAALQQELTFGKCNIRSVISRALNQ